jgi:hypothetical protein
MLAPVPHPISNRVSPLIGFNISVMSRFSSLAVPLFREFFTHRSKATASLKSNTYPIIAGPHLDAAMIENNTVISKRENTVSNQYPPLNKEACTGPEKIVFSLFARFDREPGERVVKYQQISSKIQERIDRPYPFRIKVNFAVLMYTTRLHR